MIERPSPVPDNITFGRQNTMSQRRAHYRLLSFIAIAFLLVGSVTFTANAAPAELDLTFGGTGKVTTAIGSNDDQGWSIAVQSDGKIVIAGYSDNGTRQVCALVRYNADGSLDTSFGGTGKVTTSIGLIGDQGTGVVVQNDGKIVVSVISHNGIDNDFVLLRYNPNGTLDSSFGGTGKVITNVGDDIAFSVTLQSDGKILLSGVSQNDFALLRYQIDGSLDTTFNGTGKVITPIGSGSDTGWKVAVQTDGRIVVAGDSFNGSNTDIAVARFNSNGTLDAGFGSGGKVTTSIGNGDDVAYGMALQSDGKIVVSGSTGNGSNRDFVVVRYNTNGTLDTTFNGSGIVTTTVGGGDDWGLRMALQNNGKIVMTGFSFNGSNRDLAVVRYNTNGTLDTSFNGTGRLTTALGESDSVGHSVAIQSDGKIVIAAGAYIDGNLGFAAVRYLGDPNTAPTISDIANQSTNRGVSTAAIPFTVGDAETAAASLVVSGTSSNQAVVPNSNIVFGGSGANRTVTVTPKAFLHGGQSGVATITITVSDGALTSNDSFVLTSIAPTGNVVAWGHSSATTVPGGLTGVTALWGGANGGHSLALKGDGTVVAWGANNYGQADVPAGLNGVTAIAGGTSHSVALKSDGTIVAWGRNDYGQTNIPVGLNGVTAIAGGGEQHTVVLKSNGTVVGWGGNEFGQISVPPGLTGVIAIAGGATHTLALKNDGTVVGWGGNEFGQISVPGGLTGVTAIAAGWYHSIALKSDGTVVAWGDNAWGETNVPLGLSGVTAIAGGVTHSVALKSNGTLVAWGSGQTNTGAYPEFGQAIVPAGLTGVTAIAAGHYHTVAIVAPTISSQPSTANVQRGQPVTFSITATGQGTLSYQWQKDGVDIPNATGSSYNIVSAQPWHIGNYTVKVTDTNGTVMSNVASLTLTGIDSGVWRGLVAYYPFNGNADDLTDFIHHGTNQGAAPIADRFLIPTASFSFDGTNELVEVPEAPAFEGDAIAVSVWLNVAALSPGGRVRSDLVNKDGAQRQWTLQLEQSGKIRAAVFTSGGQQLVDSSAQLPTVAWHHVVFTWDKSTLKIYVDGVLDASIAATGDLNQGAQPLRIGGDQSFFAGSLDDVRIYNRALSAIEVGQLFASENPKVLTVSPVSHGTVTGDGPFAPGATATLTATPDQGYFFSEWSGDASGATNPLGVIMDTNKTIGATFLPGPPEIQVRQPASTNLADGGVKSFGTVAVNGTSSLIFTIKNTGQGDLTGLGILIDGADAGMFTVTVPPVAPVAGPLGSTTFIVQFAPTSAGPKTAALRLASNDADENPFDLALLGNVTAVEVWRQTHFGSIANSGDGADLNDYDHDGLVNLTEFAFGFNPKVGGDGQLPVGQIIGGNFVVYFNQPPGVSGITYGAEWSTALLPNTWTTIPDAGIPPQHAFSVPVGTNNRMFMRFKVSSP